MPKKESVKPAAEKKPEPVKPKAYQVIKRDAPKAPKSDPVKPKVSQTIKKDTPKPVVNTSKEVKPSVNKSKEVKPTVD